MSSDMNLPISDPVVLAIDLRSRRSGFAIFEGRRRLLDYGTVAVPTDKNDNHIGSRFVGLLKLAVPNIVVVSNYKERTARAMPDAFIEIVNSNFQTLSISCRLLGHDAVRSTFLKLGCKTKIEISAALAMIFPELVWQLPPERKVWESEHARQRSLDAIALGVAYWDHESGRIGSATPGKRYLESD
jgi:hypothetical protein